MGGRSRGAQPTCGILHWPQVDWFLAPRTDVNKKCVLVFDEGGPAEVMMCLFDMTADPRRKKTPKRPFGGGLTNIKRVFGLTWTLGTAANRYDFLLIVICEDPCGLSPKSLTNSETPKRKGPDCVQHGRHSADNSCQDLSAAAAFISAGEVLPVGGLAFRGQGQM